jgi:hypothetical protein
LFNITSKGIGKYDILSTRIYENWLLLWKIYKIN